MVGHQSAPFLPLAKTFIACASQILTFIPSFDLLDIAPSIDLLRPLLPPNPYLKSLKLDCGRLDGFCN
ncbi:hypothetical protein NC652_024295 [Populus alba x Populus x berolinensis]|nr:hypothetical protein NC652_024295 [Populus alba x Populus x berolinensis]